MLKNDSDEDPNIDVEHLSGSRTFISKTDGRPVEVKAFLDGCSKHGKLGSNHWQKGDQETVYEIPL